MVLEEDTFLGKLSAGRRDARRRGYGSGSNELMKAVASKDLEKMKETLVGGNSANEKSTQGYAPLHIAAMIGRLDIAKLLLDHGADPNIEYAITQMTPLHISASFGHEELVNYLIQSGADTSRRDVAGNLPVHLGMQRYLSLLPPKSAEGDHRAVVQLLHNTATAEDICGQTASHIAAARGSVGTLELLLSKDIDVDAVDGRGRTPLHVAAAHCALPSIALLLAKRARCDVKDILSFTPLDVARYLERMNKNAKKLTVDLLEAYEKADDVTRTSPFLKAINYRDTTIEDILSSQALGPSVSAEKIVNSAVMELLKTERSMHETLTLREMESALSDAGLSSIPPASTEALFQSLCVLDGEAEGVQQRSGSVSGRVSRLSLCLEIGSCLLPEGVRRLQFCYEVLHRHAGAQQVQARRSRVVGRAISPSNRRRFQRSRSGSDEVGNNVAGEQTALVAYKDRSDETRTEEDFGIWKEYSIGGNDHGLDPEVLREIRTSAAISLIHFCRRRCNTSFQSLADVESFYSAIAELRQSVHDLEPESFADLFARIETHPAVKAAFLSLRSLATRLDEEKWDLRAQERSKSTRGRDFFAAQDRKTLSARHEKQFEALGPHKSKMRSKADLKEMRKAFREECKRAGVSTAKGLDLNAFSNVLERIDIFTGSPHDLFRAFDSDDSGTVSLSEFARGLGILLSGNEGERAAFLFDVWDSDGSGQLSLAELEKGLRDLLAATYADDEEYEEELRIALQTMSTNSTGQQVSYTDFLTGIIASSKLKRALLGS